MAYTARKLYFFQMNYMTFLMECETTMLISHQRRHLFWRRREWKNHILVRNNLHKFAATLPPPRVTATKISSGMWTPPNWHHRWWDVSSLKGWWGHPLHYWGYTNHWDQNRFHPTGSGRGKLGPYLLQLVALIWLEVRLSISSFWFRHAILN